MTTVTLIHEIPSHAGAQGLGRLSGRGYVPAADCSYPPAIDARDVLEVDFSCNLVARDGLYLAEVIENERCVWRGCRRFARVPGDVRMDFTGEGAWDVAPAGLRIVGRVVRVLEQK